MTRRFYIDTEFYEDGKTIDLISIGIATEEGRTLYYANSEARLDLVSPWVRENVLPHLPPKGDPAWLTRAEIAAKVLEFIPNVEGDRIQFWGYFADYDWVVFCQLFGTMMTLPTHFPMFCMDIKQVAVELGDPHLPPQNSTSHHALADAQWNVIALQYLESLRK